MILNLIKFKAFNCLCMDEILNNKDEFFYCLSCKTNSNLRDIFENHRLYCANFINLNDIMEYTFYYDINDLKNNEIPNLEGIRKQKECYKICSCSCDKNKSFKEELMWAHYANEHLGLRIDFTPLENLDIQHVIYSKKPMQINKDFFNSNGEILYNKFKEIFIRKLPDWQYEQEYRIIKKANSAEEKVYVNIKINKVILGKKFLRWDFDFDSCGCFDKNLLNFAKKLLKIYKDTFEIFTYKSRYCNDLKRII